ncbi:MAG TPA: glycine--tRNA ligase subunit beta [Bryobacteraceae bacterium]|nr:glycine--tRNA ligase subunit beta [Bryobacteraceae bacterium]
MSRLPLLIEIGTEEIPDSMIKPAVEQFQGMVSKMLQEHRLGGKLRAADGTPRRIFAIFDDVLEQQPDAEELVMGPAKTAAFKDGKPTGAAIGFAKKNGVEVDQMRIETTPKGEYVAVLRKIEGSPSKWVLGEQLPLLIPKIYFPKTMYWTGKDGVRFIRPIRWVVGLLGSNSLPLEIAGVAAGYYTAPHRHLGAATVCVNPENYEWQLNEYGVIVSSAKRRAKILTGITQLLMSRGLVAKADEGLLETLVYITEQPTPILGSFDPEFLSLPEEVLVTVMRYHQKYFSVMDVEGKLAPHFIAVMNIKEDPDGLVRHGNERVLRARFNDARFFWEFDQRKKLADRLPDLANVTFQAKLGSYLDKSNRMVALVKELGGNASAERAAQLSKCDLTTEMVKELTELQGIVGGLYAHAQGEPEAVAKAIYDQYKPASMEDSIPATPEGCLVALADKVDTLRGCFRIGLMPTSSKDPLGLRRAAQGVVKILAEGKLPLSLTRLAGGDPALLDFLLDRVRHYFKEVRGYAYDEVTAVLAAGHDDLADVEQRLAAIKAVRPTPDFEPLAASFKRIKNILKQAGMETAGEVNPALLEQGPEAELHAAFQALRMLVKSSRDRQDYRTALTLIGSLRPPVDLFFDKVLVNAPDEKVRQNRLTLLANMLTGFSSIADFSEIVTSS